MENYGEVPEVTMTDYLRLMKDYLASRIGVEAYRTEVFRLNPMRSPWVSEDVSRIHMEIFSRADDYDPVIRNERTIDEPTLRDHVQRLVNELEALGFALHELP
jgi:hypothetical protein